MNESEIVKLGVEAEAERRHERDATQEHAAALDKWKAAAEWVRSASVSDLHRVVAAELDAHRIAMTKHREWVAAKKSAEAAELAYFAAKTGMEAP